MIVIGYSADAFGVAAIEHGIAEAALRGTSLLVINATSGDAYADPRFAGSGQVHDVEERLRESGVPFELRQPWGWTLPPSCSMRWTPTMRSCW